MCRALTVLCVARDAAALAELKRATIGAEWELAPGATDEDDALTQLETERPHVLVAFGDLAHLVSVARELYPGLRIVTDRELPGASAVVSSPAEVRDAVKGLPRPGGPVRSIGS